MDSAAVDEVADVARGYWRAQYGYPPETAASPWEVDPLATDDLRAARAQALALLGFEGMSLWERYLAHRRVTEELVGQ